MISIRWFLQLIWHTLAMAIFNRAYALAATILFLLVVALLIASIQAAAPWIYTLF